MTSPLQPRAEALAAALPPLLVAARHVADNVAPGVHGRRRPGSGETFWQFRRYQSGDPASLIDWRQSAKNDPVYVRETEWEASQSVWLWRDGSASMDWRSRRDLPLKRERAELVVLALAVLLVRAGERVALLGGGRKPSGARGTPTTLAMDLETLNGDGLPPPEPLPRHGRVVLVGDFLEPLEKWSETLAGLAHRGVKGHLVQVLDPAEAALPWQGRMRLDGAEGEGSLLLGRVEQVRAAYREKMERHCAALQALARSYGWTWLRHGTEGPPERALLSLYLTLGRREG